MNAAVGNWIAVGVVAAFAAALLSTGRLGAAAGTATYDPVSAEDG